MRWGRCDESDESDESDGGHIDRTTIRQVAPSAHTLPNTVHHPIHHRMNIINVALYKFAESELIYVGNLPLIMKAWQVSFFLHRHTVTEFILN